MLRFGYKYNIMMAILLFVVGYSHSSLWGQSIVKHALSPQLDSGYGLGVSGHIAGEYNATYLLMAGGCNFPDKPARDGGQKVFYRTIYVADLTETLWRSDVDTIALSWRAVGMLPHSTAYAAFAPYELDGGEQALIVAGGKSEKEDLIDAYTISLSPEGKPSIKMLPDLPAPRSGMSSAIVGDRFYLVGGAVSGKLSNSVISISLKNPEQGWREETPYPHAEFLKVLASPHNDQLLCVGSFVGVSDPSQQVSADVTCLIYDTKTREWQLYPKGKKSVLGDVSLGGGYSIGQGGAFSGGVRSSIFVKALQREKDLKVAQANEDHRRVARLKKLSRAYLSHNPAWYGFNGKWFYFNFETKDWHLSDDAPDEGRADAVFLWSQTPQINYMIIGGETMPGVRTPDIRIILKQNNPVTIR